MENYGWEIPFYAIGKIKSRIIFAWFKIKVTLGLFVYFFFKLTCIIDVLETIIVFVDLA